MHKSLMSENKLHMTLVSKNDLHRVSTWTEIDFDKSSLGNKWLRQKSLGPEYQIPRVTDGVVEGEWMGVWLRNSSLIKPVVELSIWVCQFRK